MSAVEPSVWPTLVVQALICIALVVYLWIDVRRELRGCKR